VTVKSQFRNATLRLPTGITLNATKIHIDLEKQAGQTYELLQRPKPKF
jgi:hypothetical protein